MRKRLTSILLSMVLALTSADFTAFAAEQHAVNETVEETNEIAESEECISEIPAESGEMENDTAVSSQVQEEGIQTQEEIQEDDWTENIESISTSPTEETTETQTNLETEVVSETESEEISESETQNIIDDSDIKVTSSNSFGKLLTKSMEEEILELEQTPENNISSITIDGKQATVEFGCAENATLVVAIYDELGIKMLASGKTEVTIQQNKTTVNLDIDNMPDYFLVKGYLVGADTLKPLSSVYETPMYTREMQELLGKTTDDFDTEKVINLDDNKDNNFAVADDDTKVISNTEGENIVSKFDSDTQMCIITFANEEITSLQTGDIFVYEYEENEILVVKVADIEVEDENDGTKTATIYGAETTLEEVFAYLKIDTESELDKAQIDASETVDGVAYQGLVSDNNARVAINADDSISWSVKFTFLDENLEDSDDKLTGDVLLGIDFKTKVYLSISYYYVEIKCDYKFEVGLTISGKSEYVKKKLLRNPIGLSPVTGVYIEFMPSFVIESSAKISVTGKIKGTFGYVLSKDEGLRNISSGPSVDIEAKGEVELFVGISLEPKVKIIHEKVAKASMDAIAGGVVSAKTDPYKDEGSITHECKFCLDGDISAKFSLKAEAELNIIKKIKVTSPKLEKEYKITDFYYSADFNEFAFAICPHHKYLVKVTVLDKNSKPVTSAYVEDGINSKGYLVDDSGMASFYLPAGEFMIKAYLTNDKSITAEKKITIVDKAKEIKIILNVDEIIKEGDHIIKNVKINFGTIAAVTEDGKLYTWGFNGQTGALGNGDTQHANVPIHILNNIDTVVLGDASTAVSEDGKLYIWGYKGNGGWNDDSSYYKSPKLLIDNVQSVVQGITAPYDPMVITNSGDLYTWYQNDQVDYEKSPIKLLENVRNSSTDFMKSAITKNNELYLWRGVDRLFDNLENDVTKGEPVKVMDNVAAFKESNAYSSMADYIAVYGILSTDSSLYMLGNNQDGQLGNGKLGTDEGSANPIKILDNIVDFGIGSNYCWALDDTGTLYTWGSNTYGELGTGDTENRTVPTPILKNIREVYDYYGGMAAINQDNDLYVWGNNGDGRLGIGNNNEYCAIPTKILTNVKTIVLGNSFSPFSAAITNDGKMYMWGDNSSGQLGDGTKTARYNPVRVMDNVKDACFNDRTTAAITNDGELYMWGDNGYGQLGNGTNISSSIPMKVTIPSIQSQARVINNHQTVNLNSDLANTKVPYSDEEDAETDIFDSVIYGKCIDKKAVFNGLDANDLYNIYEIKSKNAEDILYSENLLYIAQTTADKDGNISYMYESREGNTDAILFAVGRNVVNNSPSIDQGDVLPEDVPVDGNIPEGLWIAGVSNYIYTGDAIKPEIRVYDNKKILIEKTDYAASYKDNINVGKAIITVTGKGNYLGKETAAFDILPADISDDNLSAEDFYVEISQKEQYPIPKLYYIGTLLKHKKDFTIEYSNMSGIYTQDGDYSATITGIGNYTGTNVIKLIAVAKIEKKSSMNIAKASLVGFEKSFVYTGKACRQDCMLFAKTPEGDILLTEGTDYTVRYTNNIKAGTATVTYSGKNGYTGKLKKTYKIIPYDISNDYEAKIHCVSLFEYVYAKGGSKPKSVITFDGRVMKEGADYTLSYKNNKAVYGNQTPCVVVNGKGSFKGKKLIYFIINPQDLSKMTLVSCDKVYKAKAGNYKIVPKLMDLDGKLLSAGKDFDKNSIIYAYENAVTLENGVSKEAGDAVEDTDIIPAGTQIRITLSCGNSGNYTGTFTGIYRIAAADIKSAKITIPNQTYTGKEIVLDKSQISVILSGTVLKPEDFDIIQYTDNVKKGKASVTIKGNGNYGGTKTVRFNIGAKGFLWWWKQ